MAVGESVNKLNSEINNYAKQVSPGFDNYIFTSRAPYQDFLNYLYHYYFFLSFLIDEKFPKQTKQNKDLQPLMMLYSKAALAFFGVYSCLQNGLSSEAAVLERTLFENLITVEIILKDDPYGRLKLYYDFQHVSKWNHLKRNKKLVAEEKLTQTQLEMTFSSEVIKEIEKNYKKVKHDYRQKNPFHWAWKIFKNDPELKGKNPSIKFLCGKLGREFDYVKIYSSVSKGVHSDPHIEHLVTIGDSITLTPKFSNMIYHIGAMALNYCNDLVNPVVDFINPPGKNIIKIWSKDFVFKVLNMGFLETNR